MLATLTPNRLPHTFAPAAAPHGSLRGNGQSHPPTHEEIARCAYDIYIAHGRAEGRSELNWLQAEEELARTPRTFAPKMAAYSHA